ncbi:MAG: TolC family protein [Bacteroidales bacterium]|jgi:AcrR family transcriptional regulator/outer membrane protein TolC|nr:TolC family protein [Bacteroidales bacterium]
MKDVNTEQAIIDAAEKLFLDKGFVKTTTAEIAGEAGVNHAMLHYYFRTKEKLFNMLFQKKIELLSGSLLTVAGTDLPFFSKLKMFVELQFDFFTANPKLPFFLFSELRDSPERLEIFRNMMSPVFERICGQLSLLIDEEVAKGAIRPVKPMELMMNIASLNVFLFVAQPIAGIFREISQTLPQNFLGDRKAQIVNFVTNSLQIPSAQPPSVPQKKGKVKAKGKASKGNRKAKRGRFKNALTIVLTFMLSPAVFGQLSLEECRTKARDNYPKIKQYGLIEQSKDYSLENAGKAYLPQFTFSAKASYQSDVTTFPAIIPGVVSLTRDQYGVSGELNQTVWDGGRIAGEKKRIAASADVEQKQLDVELYALNEQVNRLFFGILLLEGQLEQNTLFRQELQRNYDLVASYVAHGVAGQADLNVVEAEQWNAVQSRVRIETSLKSYRDMLSAMMGSPPGHLPVLLKPEPPQRLTESINRPELYLFDAQSRLFDSQKDALRSRNLPHVGLFLQGGVSQPGLNMLDGGLSPYYIGGIRLSWNFGNLYSTKNDRLSIGARQSVIQTQRETFLFHLNLQMMQQSDEVGTIAALMKNDEKIIALRRNIRETAEIKVAGGIFSVSDLMREVIAENAALREKALHDIQWLKALYDLELSRN